MSLCCETLLSSDLTSPAQLDLTDCFFALTNEMRFFRFIYFGFSFKGFILITHCCVTGVYLRIKSKLDIVGIFVYILSFRTV